MEKASLPRIAGFDGLRALAITLVWLEHRTGLHGSYGVPLFFALSGFLIVDIIRRRCELIEAGGSSYWAEWRRFIGRRAARILPVYYLFLAFALPAAITLGTEHIDAAAIAMHASFLVNVWINDVTQNWNVSTSHLWSLSVEEQFYTLFPLVAFALPARRLRWLCLALMLGGEAAQISYMLRGDVFRPDIASLSAFGEIATGGVAVLWLAGRRPGVGTSSLPTGLLLLLFVTLPFVITRYGSDTAQTAMHFVPFAAVAAAILLGIHRNQHALLVRLLELPPIRYLGRISYGFYVYHYLLSWGMADELFHIGYSPARWVIHIFDLAAPLAVAAVSWHWLEQPILRLQARVPVAVPARIGVSPLPN